MTDVDEATVLYLVGIDQRSYKFLEDVGGYEGVWSRSCLAPGLGDHVQQKFPRGFWYSTLWPTSCSVLYSFSSLLHPLWSSGPIIPRPARHGSLHSRALRDVFRLRHL